MAMMHNDTPTPANATTSEPHTPVPDGPTENHDNNATIVTSTAVLAASTAKNSNESRGFDISPSW